MSRRWSRAAGLAFAVLGTAGCASGSDPAIGPAAGPPPVITPSPSGADIRYDPGVLTAEAEIRAGPAGVWDALVEAYDRLDLPVERADARDRILGSGRFRAPRRIGGERLALFLDCGSTMTGRRTDNSDVFIEMTSAVRAARPGASRVATTIAASARTRDGTSTGAVPCTSTGELEKLVAARVRERIGG